MDYRLLRDGEVIESSDEAYYGSWQKALPEWVGKVICKSFTPFRRPIIEPAQFSNDLWEYNQFRAMLYRNGKFFALVTPDGHSKLSTEDTIVLLSALGNPGSGIHAPLSDRVDVRKEKEPTSPWIAIAKRKPVKGDGQILISYIHDITRQRRFFIDEGGSPISLADYWMTIPPLPNDLQQTTAAPETPIPQASSPVKERSIPKDNWMLDLLALYKTPENVCAWLSAPHRLLNYQKPIDAVLDLPNGWVKVAKIVDQLVSGAYL